MRAQRISRRRRDAPPLSQIPPFSTESSRYRRVMLGWALVTHLGWKTTTRSYADSARARAGVSARRSIWPRSGFRASRTRTRSCRQARVERACRYESWWRDCGIRSRVLTANTREDDAAGIGYTLRMRPRFGHNARRSTRQCRRAGGGFGRAGRRLLRGICGIGDTNATGDTCTDYRTEAGARLSAATAV